MIEIQVSQEQLRSSAKAIAALTGTGKEGYAGNVEGFNSITMSDESKLSYTELVISMGESKGEEVAKTQSATHEDPVRKSERIKKEWEKWMSDGNSKHPKPDQKLAEALKQQGISVDDYKKQYEFYKKHRIRFVTELPPEKLHKLWTEWYDHFGKTDESKDEYGEKYQYIMTLVAAGLSPREFARQYNWKAFFEAPPPETILSAVITLVKRATNQIIAEVLPSGLNLDDTKRIENGFASVLWDLANEKRRSETSGREPTPGELQTQKYLAAMGIGPGENGGARVEDVSDKNKEKVTKEHMDKVIVNAGIENEEDRKNQARELLLPRELKDTELDAIIAAHDVGKTERGLVGDSTEIFDYTFPHIAKKAEILKAAGFTSEEIRTLMENGIVGNGGIPAGGEGEDSDLDIDTSARSKGADLTSSRLQDIGEQAQNAGGRASEALGVLGAWGSLEQPIVDGRVEVPGVILQNPFQKMLANKLEAAGIPPTEDYIQVVRGVKSLKDLNAAFDRISNVHMGGDERSMSEFEAYYGRQIESLDDLVYEIVKNNSEKEWMWGEGGIFPLFERVYKINPQTGEPLLDSSGKPIPEKVTKMVGGGRTKKEDMIRAIPGNFHKWIMHEMEYWHDDSPESSVEFDQKIALRTEKGRELSLASILRSMNVYLKTKIWNEETGKYENYVAKDLYSQIYKDMTMYVEGRKAHLQYLKDMPNAKTIQSFMSSFHAYPSPLTRGVWNQQSFMRWDYYSPQFFQSEIEKAGWSKRALSKLSNEDKERQDGKVGVAKAYAESVYRNIMNLDENSEYSIMSLLGTDSLFFDKKRLLELRNDHAASANEDPEKWIAKANIEIILPSLEALKAAREKSINDPKNGATKEKREKKFDANILWLPNPAHTRTNGEPERIPVDKAAFRRLFNIFDGPQGDPRTEKLLRAVVANEIARKAKLYIEDKNRVSEGRKSWYLREEDSSTGRIAYRLITDDAERARIKSEKKTVWILDDDAKNIAEEDAFFSLRWKGIAALNDPDATGYDWQTRAFYATTYRNKGPTRKRNNDSGNLHSIDIQRATVMDFMRGTLTLAKKSKYVDQYGQPAPGPSGKIEYETIGKDTLYKTPLDVVYEIVKAWEAEEKEQAKKRLEDRRSGATAEQRQKNEKDRKTEREELLRKVTSQFYFRRQTQEKYFGDHWDRGSKVLEENLLGGKSIDFGKITSYERFVQTGRVDVDMTAFRKEFEDYIKPLRYGLSTYAQLDLSQEIDIFDDDGELVKVKDQNGNESRPIAAQYFFSNEILDHPQFWKSPDPKNKDEMRRSKMVEITDGKGNITKVRKIPHVIDPKELNTADGKIQLYILAGLAGFGAQVLQHRQNFTHDKRFQDEFINSMYDSLQSLPNAVMFKDIPMKNVRWKTNAISRLDIKWLREHTGTGVWKMATIAIFKSLFWGTLEGFEEAGKIMFKDVIK